MIIRVKTEQNMWKSAKSTDPCLYRLWSLLTSTLNANLIQIAVSLVTDEFIQEYIKFTISERFLAMMMVPAVVLK